MLEYQKTLCSRNGRDIWKLSDPTISRIFISDINENEELTIKPLSQFNANDKNIDKRHDKNIDWIKGFIRNYLLFISIANKYSKNLLNLSLNKFLLLQLIWSGNLCFFQHFLQLFQKKLLYSLAEINVFQNHF